VFAFSISLSDVGGERPIIDPVLKLPAALVDAVSVCWRFATRVSNPAR
jgi:hypothetical protein